MKNQILSTRINKKSNKKFFKFQFLISIFIIVILIGFICYSSISLLKKEQMSKNITSNYSIYKLYSNNSKSNESSYTQNIQNEFFGTIEIPKINLYYPVFSHLDEELLKVSPCKFYGDSPKVFGNICIAGHNYVKLRDIGKAVGFNVFWDTDSGCVQIETGAPYTGEAPSAEAVPPAAAPSDVDAAKQDIVARTNALRAERGIAALAADDQLMRAAQVRADEMAATGTYSHTRPDGRQYYTVTDCRQVGENIHQIPLLYLEQQKSALAETLIYSWSKSAGHMENMTDESYAAIGVGLARGTDANGLECWYCVQLFLRSGYSISAVDKPATK